jgi:hypothetical protein
LRASYGVTGNDRIPDLQWESTDLRGLPYIISQIADSYVGRAIDYSKLEVGGELKKMKYFGVI